MTARTMAHFSLVQSAALPAFALVLDRLREAPTARHATAAGAIVAWAFLCDPYYGVYCLMMAAFMGTWVALTIRQAPARTERVAVRAILDVAITCLAGLVIGIVLRGGGRFEMFGFRISMIRLYTPVLVLTVLALARIWLTLRRRHRLAYTIEPLRVHVWTAAVAALTCLILLAPALSAIAASFGEREWIAPRTWWRSSAAGVDLLAFLVPNPTSAWLGWISRDWVASQSQGFIENVAAIPWTATFAIAIALLYAGLKVSRYWALFTASFALLALGPFVHIAGWQTYIPAPWALLRYAPIIGAARMPTRFTVLVMLGAAVLLAEAVRQLRARSRRPWIPVALVGALLVVELVPAPRTLHAADVPAFCRTIAADPRPVKVIHLPFGIRDGMSSAGNFSAIAQFYQTFHEKGLVGGYVSRLPNRHMRRYRRVRLLRVLFDLSERRDVSAERMERAAESAHTDPPHLGIGYVIVHTELASPQLIAFARSALDLDLVATEGTLQLYEAR
jgi:hypothetical protein